MVTMNQTPSILPPKFMLGELDEIISTLCDVAAIFYKTYIEEDYCPQGVQLVGSKGHGGIPSINHTR